MRRTFSRRKNPSADRRDTGRFEQRLGEILQHAASVFYEKGYDAASMRDLSRASGMSLAGLYYYFGSKERLLYLVQKHTFDTVLRELKNRLELVNDPEQRIRVFIRNHLEYFLANRKEMTVLSHEDETLKGSFGTEIRCLKRDYYRMLVQLIEDFRRAQGLRAMKVSSRVAALSLFGMMNWIYTWHNPRVDAEAGQLATEMSQIFLDGIRKQSSGRVARR